MDLDDGSGQKKRPHQMVLLAAGLLLGIGRTQCVRHATPPVTRTPASEYRPVLMGPEKAVRHKLAEYW